MKKVLYILLTWFFYLYATALSQNPEWFNYTNGDEINALVDEGNCLWVGTRAGLVKIDKNSGETSFYDRWNSGLSNNRIEELAVDKSGNLWIVTFNGLEVFDGTNWIAYDTTNSGLPDCWINCIAVDELNNKWIGTGYKRWSYDNINPGGLVKYDDSNWTHYKTWNSDIPSDYINCIAVDGGGTIWVGTNKELSKFDGSNWTVYDDSELYDIDDITVDGFGNIWIADSGDLIKYDSKLEYGVRWVDYIQHFGSFQVDPYGYLWFSDGDVLIKTEYPYWPRISDLPGGGLVKSFVVDQSFIWLGAATYRGFGSWSGDGLFKFDQSRKWTEIITSSSPLPKPSVNVIEIDKTGDKWLSCGLGWYWPSHRLVQIDKDKWTVYDSTNSGLSKYISTFCIAIDELNQKWIGTTEGLTLFDGMNWTNYEIWNTELPYNLLAANCIAIDKNDVKWIGTPEGLVKFDGYDWVMFNIYNSDLPCDIITYITIDNTDNKWIVTSSDCNEKAGLVKYNGETWEVFNKWNSGLPHNFISCIAIDSMDNKWIGTNEYGLVKYDDIEWTLFDESNSQLPSNYINCIRIGKNNIKWIGTDKGLAKYNDEIWAIYTEENSGLVNNGVRSIAIDDASNIWIGTDYGMSVFNEGGIVSVYENNTFQETIPNDYLLYQNYPNPFNPSTKIRYSVPQFSNVVIRVFDILGNEIETLINEEKPMGGYELTWNAAKLPSGVYFYQLQAGSFVETKKMVLLR